MVAPKRDVYSQPINVTLFGNRAFTEIFKNLKDEDAFD